MSVPRYRLIFGTLLLSGMLAGCMATPEERIVEGVSNAREAFEEQPESTNETVGEIDLYMPSGYEIEEPADDFNRLITKGSESFALFINPNEKATSTLFYDLQKADPEQQWVADETFQQNGRFGFATVKEIAEDQLELVVSAGGVKLTTITKESDIPKNMNWMMKTVRSIDTDE